MEDDVGVAGAVQEMGARDQHVHRGQIELWVRGVHHQDFQPQAGQGFQAEVNLVLEIGPGEVGQAVQGFHRGAGGHEIGRLLQGLIFGERGPVAGAAVEIPGQLRHLGQGPDQGLGGVGGGAGGKDDLAVGGEGGRVVGQGRHRGDATGVQGEIPQMHHNAVVAELGQQLPGGGVGDRIGVDGRGGRRSWLMTEPTWRSTTSPRPWSTASSRQLPAAGPLYSSMR